jgi:hypothetical protein
MLVIEGDPSRARVAAGRYCPNSEASVLIYSADCLISLIKLQSDAVTRPPRGIMMTTAQIGIIAAATVASVGLISAQISSKAQSAPPTNFALSAAGTSTSPYAYVAQLAPEGPVVYLCRITGCQKLPVK